MKKTFIPLLFLFLIGLLSIYFGYPEQFSFTPRSTHQWRQADGASIALNYYQNGMNFFEPKIHHVLSGGGHTVGEFPGIYYLTAICYKIFGVHEGIFRLINFIIFVWGLWLLQKLTFAFTNDHFYSFVVALFLFASPVITFYAFNFIPNTPALGLVFAASWFFYQYYKEQRLRPLWISMFLFLLAGLLKPTILVLYFAILGAYILELLFKIDFGKEKALVSHRWKALPAFLLVIVGVGIWMVWAQQYNESHNTGYFLAKVKPIWSIEEWQRKAVYNQVIYFWSWAYFHRLLFYATGLLGLIIFCFPKKLPRLIYFLNLLVLLGVIAIIVLWYPQFEHHDYYFTELIVYPVIVWLSAVMLSQRMIPKLVNHWASKLLVASFLIYNLHHAKLQMTIRYNPEGDFLTYFNPSFYKTTELQSFLKEIGLEYPARVISIPDQSPNNTLYHLNLMGWTELFMPTPLPAGKIKELANAGARYLIIGDKAYLEREDLQELLQKPVGNFEDSIFVFDLR